MYQLFVSDDGDAYLERQRRRKGVVECIVRGAYPPPVRGISGHASITDWQESLRSIFKWLGQIQQPQQRPEVLFITLPTRFGCAINFLSYLPVACGSNFTLSLMKVQTTLVPG